MIIVEVTAAVSPDVDATNGAVPVDTVDDVTSAAIVVSDNVVAETPSVGDMVVSAEDSAVAVEVVTRTTEEATTLEAGVSRELIEIDSDVITLVVPPAVDAPAVVPREAVE